MDNKEPKTISDSDNSNWPKSCALAIRLSQRLDLDDISALYLAISDCPETLLAAIGPHIERMAELRKRAAELTDAKGSPSESINYPLIAALMKARKES